MQLICFYILCWFRFGYKDDEKALVFFPLLKFLNISLAFIEMGKGLWDMDPATGLKIRAAAPPGAKADVIAFLTLKDGVTVADYEAVFGQHADSKTVAYKGKSYEVPATRRAFCAEERTRIYVDTKEDSDLAVCLYDVDVALMGEVMGAAGFVAIGSLMWDLTAVEFMVPPPPPPGA